MYIDIYYTIIYIICNIKYIQTQQCKYNIYCVTDVGGALANVFGFVGSFQTALRGATPQKQHNARGYGIPTDIFPHFVSSGVELLQTLTQAGPDKEVICVCVLVLHCSATCKAGDLFESTYVIDLGMHK